MSKALYIISCGAPPARNVTRLIEPAQREGWDVCLLATPSAMSFIDPIALEAKTGHPVRSTYKEPGSPDVLPSPDAIIVAPATVNTIDKWACGICDTLALGILVEAIGKKIPTVALPFTNYAHAAHPAFAENIEKLRSWGVRVLFGPDVYPLHAPGTGSQHLDRYPWHLTLDALNAMTSQPESA
ncbi:MAG: flavoprotein [Streptosporangiaceae bacterium]